MSSKCRNYFLFRAKRICSSNFFMYQQSFSLRPHKDDSSIPPRRTRTDGRRAFLLHYVSHSENGLQTFGLIFGQFNGDSLVDNQKQICVELCLRTLENFDDEINFVGNLNFVSCRISLNLGIETFKCHGESALI